MYHSPTFTRLFFANIRLYLMTLAIAAASWWLAEYFQYQQDQLTLNNPATETKHSADYFGSGYAKKELDALGKVKTELFAEKIRHYTDDGITYMDKAVMTFYDASNNPPWIIKADNAKLSADSKDLFLIGQVTINRNAAESIKPVQITTSNLHIKTEENYAEGVEWAQLLSPPNRMEGIGIQMTFKKPISLKLLSNVKSYYELN